MGGKFSRDKGQRAERAVIALLQPIVDKVFAEVGLPPAILQRNLMQSMCGGFDIVGLDWMALEVKHHEKLQINDWWAQTVKQSKSGNITRLPVLFYKSNGMKWNVMMEGLVEIVPDAWEGDLEVVAGDGGFTVTKQYGTKGKRVRCPVTISQDSFLLFFEHKLRQELKR